MKKTAVIVLLLLLMLSALADTPLTVNGVPVSEGEIRAYLLTVREAYADTASYYDTALGIDYWALTYPNGQTVEQAVKADAFRGLVVLNALYQNAVTGGLTLTDGDRAAIGEAVELNLNKAAQAGCSREELYTLYEKQVLSEKQYSYLLSYEEIDESAAREAVDKSRYVTYDVLCFYAPSGFFSEEEKSALDGTMLSLAQADGINEEALPAGISVTELTLSDHLSSDASLLEAAKALKEGEVSPVIQTEYGLFVLKLTRIDDGDAFYLNAVEDALRYAREDAYSDKYNALYTSAEYTLDFAFWDEITLR